MARSASRRAASGRGRRRIPASAALHGTHHGARRRAGLVYGLRRVRPAADNPAIWLLRHGGDLGPRGGAPRDVGAHLCPELGASGGGGRNLGDTARRRLLVPVTGETDRQREAVASAGGSSGRYPAPT